MSSYDRSHPEIGRLRGEITQAVRDERSRAYVGVDVAAPLVVAVLWLITPFHESMADRIGGASAIAAVGYLAHMVRIKAPAKWANLAPLLLRLTATWGLAAMIPSAWNAAAVLVAVMIVGSIPLETRPHTYLMLALSSGALALIGLWREVPHWYLSLLIMVVGTVATEQWFRIWLDQRNEVDRRHNEILDRASIFSWEIDARTGTILAMVGNVEAILGYTVDELVGKSVLQLVDRQHGIEARKALERGDFEGHHEVRAVHRDGHEVVLREVRLEAQGHIIQGISVDMTELAGATDALRFQAEHDSLTGLANREMFQRTVTDAFDVDPQAEIALIIADLDRFKEINDTLGHPVGDRLLGVLSERYRANLDDADVIARIGGDEFAFVITGEDIARRAKELADQIHLLSAAPLEVDGLKLAVSSSVGIAYAPVHGTSYADLLKHADIAMYQSKHAGGGVLVFESTPDAFSVQRLQLLSEMAEAIERREFELHMQPQVDLTTGLIVGVEGLARWRHPEFGLLLPGAFLHTVEVAADYHRFTAEMVRQAIDFAASAAASGHDLNVAVNLGSMSFLDQSLPVRLREMLSDRRLPGHALTLEVTESDLIDTDAPVFDALTALGMRLSIDDFGTGYSSLTRLRAISVDEVKIDQAFVAGLGVSAEDEIIVRSVLELCQSLGHSVVAEGVETVEQMTMLRGFGCTMAQGFLFEKALPQSEMLERINSGKPYDVGQRPITRHSLSR